MSSGLFKGKPKKKQPSPSTTVAPPSKPPPVMDSEPKQMRWTVRMTDVMLNTLLEEVARDGRQVNNQISKVAQQAAALAVNRAIDMKTPVTCENVRSKYKTLKSHYVVVRDLLNLSGFGFTFCSENKKVISADKMAWDNYCQANPEAKKWRNKTFPWHEAMVTLAGDEIANGELDNGGDESPDIPDDGEWQQMDGLEGAPSQCASPDGVAHAPCASTQASASTDIPTRHDIPPQANVELPSKRRKSRFSQETSYNKGIMEAIQNLADSLIATAPSTVIPETYMDRIKVALDVVAGDDRELYADGLEFLAINTTLGEVFLRLDECTRLGWLRRKLSIAGGYV